MKMNFPKTAVVHDWIDAYGGAERVIETICDLVQPASFHTLLANPKSALTKKLGPILKTSALQKIPFAFSFHRYLLQFYPYFIEQMDLRDANLIISSSHCVAKGVLTRSDQLHISYVHTPARYLWDQSQDYLEQNNIRGLKRAYVEWVFHRLRQWDVNSSSRVDLYIANSKFVSQRIWKTYRRPSIVVYPFVDLSKFVLNQPAQKENHFVVLSRLVSQKRVDIAVRACSKLGIKLKVIGDGPEINYLRSIAGQTVEFLGQLDHSDMIKVVSSAQGLIFTPEEDFGIVPLEAMAVGTPVLAFGRGGALETVISGKTGAFFTEQTDNSLILALQSWRPEIYDFNALRERSRAFDSAVFTMRFSKIIHSAHSFFIQYNGFNEERFLKEHDLEST
ncbi:MAG: glycosyltransferase [Deltaproteobacteria bacterium]|nr:glycosyltransferase [Deltaproteobacteria bacterium]